MKKGEGGRDRDPEEGERQQYCLDDYVDTEIQPSDT